MTIGGWVTFGIMVTLIMAVAIGLGTNFENIGMAICVMIGMILCGVTLAFMLWYFSSTASGARALKSQESNFNNGIERKVTVFDIEGDIIKEYEGKFDVEYDDDRILFDDEKGLRHIIYYPTGTVIIDEVEN